MKTKLLWITISFLIILSVVLVSCAESTTTTSTTATTKTTATTQLTTATTTSGGTPSQTTVTTTSGGPPPATTTTQTAANWWDKDGTPQHGGIITLPTFRTGSLEGNFDNISMGDFSAGYFDELFAYDWVIDRNEYGFQVGWVPDKYIKPSLAESWEWTDAQTLVCHLRQDVKWHNKAPVNGREFTAYDVQYHFDRIMGTGSGFTEPAPMYMGPLTTLKNVVANDKYTIVINFKNPTPVLNAWQVYDPVIQHFADPQEWVEQGDTTEWQNAVGTGPFLLTDFVAGSSQVLSRNPDYWGYDTRHPDLQLPYADQVKLLSIPDLATTVAAMRTQKIDMMIELSVTQMDTLGKSNPDILKKANPTWSEALTFRIDKGIFSDIKVRKAMEMALDRTTISKSLWGTDGKPCGVVPPVYQGFTDLYDDWPQDLKDEYSYNLDKARDFMTEAGYPTGFITNVIAGGNNDLNLLQIEKAMFQEIGVEVEIRMMDGPSGRQFIEARKHDGMTVAMGGVGTPPLMSFENATNQRNPAVCPDDPTYEAWVEDFRKSMSVEEAMQKSKEGVYYLLRQHWTTGPMPTATFNTWQPYLKGYNGEGGPSFYGMRGWYYARFWVDQTLK